MDNKELNKSCKFASLMYLTYLDHAVAGNDILANKCYKSFEFHFKTAKDILISLGIGDEYKQKKIIYNKIMERINSIAGYGAKDSIFIRDKGECQNLKSSTINYDKLFERWKKGER